MDCYSERSHLLALLSAHYPAHAYMPDDADPGFTWVVCLHFPWGQASWHIADDDMRMLFSDIKTTDSDYDGHTTEDKYARMRGAMSLGQVS